MAKSFRILTIALATMALMVGSALAGPTGPGKDNGDPDIPNSPLKRAPVHADTAVDPGTSAKVSTGAIEDEARDRWIRLLRTYFRFVKAVRL